MLVFKFGGASVNSVDRIGNIIEILNRYKNEKILIVISAIGKTTNALERVAEAFFRSETGKALELFSAIKQDHLEIASHLGIDDTTQLKSFFTEAEWLLQDKPVKSFDYYYDQIVCIGELLSTSIISSFLNASDFPNKWMDVRDVIRTDDNFRDANIDWNFTGRKVKEEIKPLFDSNRMVITQGFIGSTDENESTTLGREGSDYTAAVFANLLDADAQIIWKDVKGIMNADPKQFSETEYISELNYDEIIEMAYYGAQVIHPKTIKPLENKNIPLYVKCFSDPEAPGTVIHHKKLNHLPPMFVLKENQVLVHLSSHDFSFVGEKPISELYKMLAEIKIKPNLIQTGAVNIMLCLDDKTDKIEKLIKLASAIFNIELEEGLTLLTIRHFNEKIANSLIAGRPVLLKQQTSETVQLLLK